VKKRRDELEIEDMGDIQLSAEDSDRAEKAIADSDKEGDDCRVNFRGKPTGFKRKRKRYQGKT
jgi:hypothetical protein